jgi:hypothetical protein
LEFREHFFVDRNFFQQYHGAAAGIVGKLPSIKEKLCVLCILVNSVTLVRKKKVKIVVDAAFLSVVDDLHFKKVFIIVSD